MRLDRVLYTLAAGGLAYFGWSWFEDAEASRSPLAAPTAFAADDIEGDWHVLAHIPYFLENNRVAPTLSFTRRDDGALDEVYAAQKGSFDAPRESFEQTTWSPDPARPWLLKTLVFKVIPARYQVLDVDRKAGIALLGTADRDKAWILKRTARLSAKDYRAALAKFSAQGFDAARILRIAQRPADLGKDGYARVES